MGAAATCMFVKVSVNATPVRAEVPPLVTVNVSVVVDPC